MSKACLGDMGAVVYDMDDILFPYTIPLVAQRCGIEPETWQHFYVPDNDWSDEVKAQANLQFHNTDNFKNIQFFPGAEEIMRPYFDFGVPVMINSNAISAEVEDLKREQLLAAIPGLTQDMITINHNILNKFCDKKLPQNTWFFVDDSPYHITRSTARINLLLRWPWNTTSAAQAMMQNVRYMHMDSLQKINQFIYYRIKKYAETSI